MRKHLKGLWIVTGVAALLLLGLTLRLAAREREGEAAGTLGYVAGPPGAIYLRAQPGVSGAILTVLQIGMPVRVSSQATQEGAEWVYVETDSMAGWLPARRVSFDPP